MISLISLNKRKKNKKIGNITQRFRVLPLQGRSPVFKSQCSHKIILIMKEKIYALVAQGVLTKEQADAVWNVIWHYDQDDEEILISLSECV